MCGILFLNWRLTTVWFLCLSFFYLLVFLLFPFLEHAIICFILFKVLVYLRDSSCCVGFSNSLTLGNCTGSYRASLAGC